MIASGPDREGLTAELWLDDNTMAETFYENGMLRLRLFPPRGAQWWSVDYEEFSEQLRLLRERLLGTANGV